MDHMGVVADKGEQVTTAEQTALGIYVVMARDSVDALEMIQKCGDREALTLLALLVNTETNCIDLGLNVIFVDPIERRMNELKENK